MSRSRINNMFLKSYESNSAIKISKYIFSVAGTPISLKLTSQGT